MNRDRLLRASISLQEYTSHSSIRKKWRRDTSARPHIAARTRAELGSRLTQPRRSPHALGSAAQQCAGAPQWSDGGGWMRFCEQYSLLGAFVLAPGCEARPQAPAACHLSHTAAASQLSSTTSGFKTCLNSPSARVEAVSSRLARSSARDLTTTPPGYRL